MRYNKRYAAQRSFRFMLVFFFVSGLDACSSYNPNWVASQWSDAMTTLNIDPVYPPTEDLHVGDVYVTAEFSQSNDSPQLLSTTTKYWYVDLTQWLKDYYNNVPVMPDTGTPPAAGQIWLQTPAGINSSSPSGTTTSSSLAGKAVAAKAKVVAKPAGQDPKPVSVFNPVGTMTTLPLEAFPGFTLSNANSESFSASIPGEVLSALIGAGRKHQDATSVKILEAETYGVPEFVARKKLLDLCAATAGSLCNPRNVWDAAEETSNEIPQSVSLYLIYRVYLTRSIEYTYDASTVIGAEGKLIAKLKTAVAQQTVSQTSGESNPSSSTSTTTQTNTSASTTTPSAQQQLADELSAIQSAESNLGSSAPGGTFSIGTASDEGISLVETFQRPVAIGYRAAKIVVPEPQSN